MTRETIRIRQRFDTHTILSLTWLSIPLLGLPWLFASRAVGGEFLVHYCGNCGLRLLYFTSSYNVRLFVGDDELTGQPPNLSALKKASLSQSPYPIDAQLVHKTDFNRWKERYRHQEPTETFTVAENQNGFPTELRDAEHSQRLYHMTYPDLDVSPNGKFGLNLLWKYRKDDSALPSPSYSPPNSSLCVYQDGERGKHGLAQLAQLKWDVMFYFPKEEGGYESRMQFIKYPGLEAVFDLTYPYFRWESCEGELVWVGRPVMDARSSNKPNAKPDRELVLLDRYDRIVAMRKVESPKQTFQEAYSAAKRAQNGEQRPKQKSVIELRLYGEFSKRLVLEIVTSYAVVMVQIHRAFLLASLRRQKRHS